MKKLLLILLAMNILKAQSVMENDLKMPAIFSDNMVLQQKTDAAVWGQAPKGTKVFVSGSWGSSAEAVSNSDGNWLTKIETPGFGGPYELKIENNDSKIIFKNVLIGEVWLCSGQSNMEMPLAGWPPNDTIAGSESEIKNANLSNIRLFTVTRIFATEPQNDCSGTWLECSPGTAPQFSATAFFFGKKLYEDLNIPVGLIHSSWGGTPVESWISKIYLGSIERYKNIYNKIDESRYQIEVLNKWLFSHPSINVNDKPEQERWKNLKLNDDECSATEYDDSSWPEMNLPQPWENTEVGSFDGVIWFRKNIEIPQNWINKNLILELGPIDDMDITFVNGNKVGGYESSGFWNAERIYEIPSQIVTTNNLSIAVRVLDNQGGGGIWGKADQMLLRLKDNGEKLNINGVWKYLPVAEFVGGKLFVFGSKNNEYKNRPPLSIRISDRTISSLYNGMIAPLIPYSIEGAIWYQGEANIENAYEYKNLFSMMIKNWREDFKNEFSFYFTQIAPYDYGEQSKSQLLREAQFKTLDVPNTGMAVTMDIGNVKNIHPANKKDVGERLARWALAKNYNMKIPFSGPLYKSLVIENGKAVLSFEFADKLNLIPRNGKINFQIAGEDKIFYEAFAQVENDKLIVYSPKVNNPAAVRYSWNNRDEATLFNGAGLPSPSFRTDNWTE